MQLYSSCGVQHVTSQGAEMGLVTGTQSSLPEGFFTNIDNMMHYVKDC